MFDYRKLFFYISLLYLFVLSPMTLADVVKPALIEVNVNAEGTVDIEVRASIEALLTGINSRYKNTQDAPNADEYDFYREMEAEELGKYFTKFQQTFLDSIKLSDGQNREIELSIANVDIPEPGYTKVPRISLIELKGEISPNSKSLQWYYPFKFGNNAVRLRQIDEANKKWHWSEWQWLRKDDPSTPFSLSEIEIKRPIHQVVTEYIVIGFEHIIPKGLDHILFILGLFLFSTQFRPLLWQVTMFTIAHTITLGLSMNGIINLPANIVEPLIALSIAYVGIENVFAKSLHKSRLILVFLFGLLHGLGFASVLSDFGMPDHAFMTALISFNIGVEIGQLAIILTAYLMFSFLIIKKPALYKKLIAIPGSLLIAFIAIYWTAERLLII